MSALRPARRLPFVFLVCVLLIAAFSAAQTLAPTDKPLPFGQGEQGLKQQLRKLQTTGRLLEIDAHPDDEDGDVLAMMARGRGYSVTLLTITRGEGGQNRLGSALFDALGVLRTLELLESDKYYGIEQRFTRMADFGFSKSPQETLQKWGHDAALADVVRVIREVQPDVVVAKFAGDERDGHGHHQASAILAREAFRAAGDPNKFPEQFKDGLHPWQAKKFYMRGFEDDHTLSYDTNVMDPVIGMTYAQLHLEGLKHQQSQLSGTFTIPPGPRMRYYKLVDSTLPKVKPGTKEKDFFDGIDTSPSRLAELAPPSARKRVGEMIDRFKQAVSQSTAADERHDNAGVVRSLLHSNVCDVRLVPRDAAEFAKQWNGVCMELGHAIALAANCSVKTKLDGVQPGERLASITPGSNFTLIANATCNVAVPFLFPRPAVPTGWTVNPPISEVMSGRFIISVPKNASVTRQHWERENPETDTRYRVEKPSLITRPLPHLPVSVVLGGNGPLDAQTPIIAIEDQPLIVVPPVAITTKASVEVLPSTSHDANIGVELRDTSTAASEATTHLQLPSGWNAQPATQTVRFAKPDDKQDITFHVTAPQQPASGMQHLTAIADERGKAYSDGFEIVTRDDLGAFPYYAPARERISVVDVKVPPGLKVGYIMGAGDDIPTVLKQVGIDVTEIPPTDIASSDLSKFGTIVLGIRAYDTQEAVRANNQRLLDYVKNGGTLVVQYNSDVNRFNSGHFTPYPFDLSRDRVSVEEQPVEVLAPDDPILKFPNAINAHDFDNWVQERGLYFVDNWDSHFEPLLACNDPGEPSRKGGLLRANYGKGTYIYTGYAFFRQLPAGVPGAVRLFVNLVSAGHEQQSSAAGSQ